MTLQVNVSLSFNTFYYASNVMWSAPDSYLKIQGVTPVGK